MILSDRGIEEAIRKGEIIIDPPVQPSQFDSSSLNLRVGNDFVKWNESLFHGAVGVNIDLDNIDLAQMNGYSRALTPESDGTVIIKPEWFVLVRTLEHIALPLQSKLAARVEGRSKQARLGMTAHITAPTIHAGFKGKITLEIKNFSPFNLVVRPNQSKLCQLIFERVATVPARGGSRAFSNQETPLGTPPNRPG